MDNRISDKDLEFVNGGVNSSEEAIIGAIHQLEAAVTLCAQSQILINEFKSQISGLAQRLQSCNGNEAVIEDVTRELSDIKTTLNSRREALKDSALRDLFGKVYLCLRNAINKLA